jgi:metal-responsive CopG/Arc/MetJ family transcriptional regulator
MRDTLRMTMRVPTNLMLPPDLVAQIDEVAGPRNRSRFIEEAARAKLKREQLRLAIERSVGVLKAEDYPEWATSEMVVEWVRKIRAEETDPGPED